MQQCKKCGKQIDDNATVCPYCDTKVNNALPPAAKVESKFTGGVLMNLAVWWAVGFVVTITLGFGLPAVLCWAERWKAEHTYINGRQLAFDGKAMQLFGKFCLWMLLTLVTLFIYLIFLIVHVRAWIAKHTHFVEDGEVNPKNKTSSFDGKWYQYLGVIILSGFVSLITFGIGFFWAHCYKERWFCKHTLIDGEKLSFNGKWYQYLGKCLLWIFLTIITFGIYGFWLQVNSIKWTVSHTALWYVHLLER